jgi:branched-chain amino acid aminotransferase
MNISYLNGSKREPLAAISLYNPTFLYGINCFEGIRAYWKQKSNQLIFFDLAEHLSRLYSSAKHMAFTPPLQLNQLQGEILEIARAERIQEDVYVRITFFLGDEGSWHSVGAIHYLISFRSLASELGSRPSAALGISTYRRISELNMPPFVKAGANYLNSRYGMLDVRARGFDDALFLTTAGFVSEASGSTIFFFRGNEIHTPSIECDILPGITRGRLLKLCRDHKLPVQETKIIPESIRAYDGAILTGTMIEIRPVYRIESWFYNSRSPLYDQLVELLRDYIYQMDTPKCVVSFNG